MALSWKTLRSMPRLTSYADAAAYEAKIKPIRGREPEVKPLGRRNMAWWNIKREENGDIVVGSWYGPLIRYRENGDVVLYDMAGWSKASLNEVVTEVTGIHCSTYDSKVVVNLYGESHYLRPSPRPLWNRETNRWGDNPEPPVENIFRRVEKVAGDRTYFAWTFVNPQQRVVHHIRRKEMNRVLKQYANFVAYATGMDSIRDHKQTEPGDYVELFNVVKKTSYNGQLVASWWSEGMPTPVQDLKHEEAAQLCQLMLSDDATDKYKAYLWLNCKKGWGRGRTLRTDELVKRVATMHHHTEVLKPIEVSGVTKDRYGWAVPA